MISRDKATSQITRPHRKPKAPKGALGARLKAKVDSRSQQSTRALSPLPPSSPFASSSSQMMQDFLPVATSEFHPQEIETRFYEEVEVDAEERDFESDVYRTLEEGHISDTQEPVHSAQNSDPFGFFAVEAKLKAERIQQSIKTLKAPFAQILKVPRSPHKPRIRNRSMTASGPRVAVDGDTPSLPSSPSPAKPRRVTKKEKKNSGTEKELSEDDTNEQVTDPLNDQPRKRTKIKAGGRQKQCTSDKSIDPETLARDLKALLPKRATRRNVKRRADSDSDEAGHKRRHGLKRGKASKNGVGDEERDTERQKRLEYFRKLEDYKVAKENVYVI